MYNNELDKLHAWFTINKLPLNISKTNYILFGRRRCIADDISITMGITRDDTGEVRNKLKILTGCVGPAKGPPPPRAPETARNATDRFSDNKLTLEITTISRKMSLIC